MSNSSNISSNDAESSMADFVSTTAIKRGNIRETLEMVHSQSNSLLRLAVHWKDLEEYFDAVLDAIAKREEDIKVKKQEIEWKQKYLNKKASDLEVKEERVEEDLRMANDRREEVDEAYDVITRYYREVKEKEKFVDEELEVVRCKSERLRENKRDLKRKFEKRELKLESRELMVDNLEKELEVRKTLLNAHERGLLERFQEVELREKRLEERIREFQRNGKVFELKNEEEKVGDDGVKAKDGEHANFDDGGGDDEGGGDEGRVDPSYADLKFNVTMDGRALQRFLNGRVNDHEVLRDEVITGLGMSADPPKLVLDAMQGFYPEELGSDERVRFDLNVVRKSCILLLEQLNLMKPRIKTSVRERSMRLALEWKGKMKVDDADHYLEIVGFLQLVATYGFSGCFTKSELASLFENCAMYDRAPELCCNLGLTEDTNEIIQNLILRHQPFDAIRLVYAFGLFHIFPPVPILKSHLMFSFHLAEEVSNNGGPSLKLQIECIRMKVSALTSIVRCIRECGLESKYPIQPLEQLLSELEMQEKSLVSASQIESTRENEELSVSHYPISCSAMLASGSCDESLVTCGEVNPVSTDSPNTEPQSNKRNKYHLASVVVAKDCNGQQPVSTNWVFSGRAPVYHCLNQSWRSYGSYTQFPY